MLPELSEILQCHPCVSVRIDMTKDLPMTIPKEYLSGKKSTDCIHLAEAVNAEDYYPLLAKIEELSANGATSLRAICRFLPDNKPYFVCCERRREKKLTKTVDYLAGTIIDIEVLRVSEAEMPTTATATTEPPDTGTRPVKLPIDSSEDISLAVIFGKDELARRQLPLARFNGVHSAIFDNKNNLICTHDPRVVKFDVKDYKYNKQIQIKINYIVYATWIIASNDEVLLDASALTHEILADCMSKGANITMLLHNEMVNNEHANKLLGETIEQQMLLNNIYNRVLNEYNSQHTVRAVIDMTGDFLRLNRIAVCEDVPESQSYRIMHEWFARTSIAEINPDKNCKTTTAISDTSDTLMGGSFNPVVNNFNYDQYPELLEELKHYETYFSSNPEHNVLGLDFSSYVASNLPGEGGKKYGIIVYIINDAQRVLTYAEKRLLRSVSQIIAAVIMRCKDNNELKRINQELEQSNKLLDKRTFYDTAFNIKNRNSLEKELSEALDSGKGGAIVAFKIPALNVFDNYTKFSRNNETADDASNNAESVRELLSGIEQFAKEDTELYRFSEDVFVAIMHHADKKKSKAFCEKLKARLKNNHHLEVTLGVAHYSKSGDTFDTVIRSALLHLLESEATKSVCS